MKILFVGLGGIGQRHCRNIRDKFGDIVQILAYRVRGLTQTVSPSLSIEAGVDVNKKYNIILYNQLESALDQKPDITFITNPSSLHIPIAIKAAKSGSHLFIEKPISNNLDRIQDLISLTNKNKLIGMVGYQLRFHPGIELINKILANKGIGKILSVHAEVGEYLPNWHKYEDYRKMYAARKELGGGVVLSQIHEFDYLYSWFGMPHEVYAVGGHLSSLEIDTEDTAKVIMQVNYLSQSLPISVHMDFNQQPPSRGCKIIGEKGKIELNLIAQKVIVNCIDGVTEHDFSDFERNKMFTKELDHFFLCIENGEQTMITIEDGVESLKIALAIKESLDSGIPVKLFENEKHVR